MKYPAQEQNDSDSVKPQLAREVCGFLASPLAVAKVTDRYSARVPLRGVTASSTVSEELWDAAAVPG